MAKGIAQIQPLSVNEAWQGRRYKSKKYKSYETELLYLLPAMAVPEGALSIEIEFGFSNAAKDIDNPVKPFLDILQKRYRFDDKQIYELYIVKKIVSKGKEYIAFKINKYGN
jgi:Holliday junction resolvase RusA-like endonuclease